MGEGAVKHRGDYRFIHHPSTFIIRRSPPPQQAGVLHNEKNVRPATKRKHRRNRPTDWAKLPPIAAAAFAPK